MDLKEGFKDSQIGLIPSDWETRTIGEVFELINGCAFKPSDWKQSGIPIIRIQNLNDAETPFNYFQGPVAERNKVESGDLLFAWSGTIGSSFGARIWPGPAGVLNQHIFKVLTDHSKLAPSFALIVFSRVEEDIAREAHGFKASFVHVKKSDLQRVKLQIPPIREQRAIAAALSDVDALIAGLERLIAKKRDIKQAAMQQLLTGKTRLPGFTGEWGAMQLGQVGECLRGVAYRGDADLYPHDTERTKRLLRSNNVQDSMIVTDDVQFVNAACVNERQILRVGDILICMANGSKALVGKAGYFDLEDGFEYTFGAFMGVFRGHEIADRRFVFYLLQTGWYRDYISNLLAGSSINNLSPASIESLEFAFPERKEQTAIAAILSDMDAELSAIESRLAKTRAIKQGMMQELLTGRTRLV